MRPHGTMPYIISSGNELLPVIVDTPTIELQENRNSCMVTISSSPVESSRSILQHGHTQTDGDQVTLPCVGQVRLLHGIPRNNLILYICMYR